MKNARSLRQATWDCNYNVVWFPKKPKKVLGMPENSSPKSFASLLSSKKALFLKLICWVITFLR